MTPVDLNEFLVMHPAMLKLRLQVDEAAVAVKHAHVEGLLALSDKNTPLITRWHKYFRECNQGHQIFMGAFYREMTSVLNLGWDTVRTIDRDMLKRKIELDECIGAMEEAEQVFNRAFHHRNTALMRRWHEYFETHHGRYHILLNMFRWDFLGLPPSMT
jgi:hypothetical protein